MVKEIVYDMRLTEEEFKMVRAGIVTLLNKENEPKLDKKLSAFNLRLKQLENSRIIRKYP
jgi:hypothetical protein